MSVLAILIIAALLALSFAAFNFFSVKKLEEGSPRMQQIAALMAILVPVITGFIFGPEFVGGTVGDPLKETVGPCLDIFIKIMSTVSLGTVSVFAEYNLFGLLQNLLK